MCMSFKDTLGGRVYKKVDDVRTSMWSKLGFDAIRDPLGEKIGVSSKHTNVDSTKKAKPVAAPSIAASNPGLRLGA